MAVSSETVITVHSNGTIQISGNDAKGMCVSVHVNISDEDEGRRFLQLLSPFCSIQGREPSAHWMQQAHLEERYVSHCIAELPCAEDALFGHMLGE